MVIFQALVGCHDIVILGKCPIKWRQCPGMTLAVDWDNNHQCKYTVILPDAEWILLGEYSGHVVEYRSELFEPKYLGLICTPAV